jgi:hypothetical protein
VGWLVRRRKFSQLLIPYKYHYKSNLLVAVFTIALETVAVTLFFKEEGLLFYVFPQLLKLLLAHFRATTSYLNWKSKILF